ncbi:MAG: hypothetical protein FWC51_02275 [Proteobacteria bacterium]|nr:hypothetical protein [Pseudomonadota bacterium]
MTQLEMRDIFDKALGPIFFKSDEDLRTAAERDDANFRKMLAMISIADPGVFDADDDGRHAGILKVFKYVLKITAETCDKNKIPGDYGFGLSQDVLSYRYINTVGPEIFREFIDSAQRHAAEYMKYAPELASAAAAVAPAQENRASINDGKRGVKVPCNLCMMRDKCTRAAPEDCYFIDSAMGIIGSENITKAPHKDKFGFGLTIRPRLFDDAGTRKQLIAMKNYFQNMK